MRFGNDMITFEEASVVHKIHKAGGRSHLRSDHAPDIHDPQAAFR